MKTNRDLTCAENTAFPHDLGLEIARTGDIAEAKLAGGKLAYMKLKREPGVDGRGVVLRNVKYFDAVQNDGFVMYRSIEHRVDVEGHKFSYSDRNAFLITIVSQEPATQVKGKSFAPGWHHTAPPFPLQLSRAQEN